MSVEYYRDKCQRYRGRAIVIRTREGGVHRGIIRDVNGRKVFLQPIDERRFGGYGYGYYGYYGFGPGFSIGIAIGAITSLVLLPFFFW